MIIQAQKRLRSRSVVYFGDSRQDREISLHSPGQLLNTPRDSSRRYEYPFPSGLISTPTEPSPARHLRSHQDCQTPSSPRHSLDPLFPLGSSSNLVSTATLPPRTSSSPSRHTPMPVPVPVPQTPLETRPQAGPSSHQQHSMHPKLSKYKPSDAPVPPSPARTHDRARKILQSTSPVRLTSSLPATPTAPSEDPLNLFRARSREREPEPAACSHSGLSHVANTVGRPDRHGVENMVIDSTDDDVQPSASLTGDSA